MDLLQCVGEILGCKAAMSLSDLHNINALASAVRADPLNMENHGPFLDALEEQGVAPNSRRDITRYATGHPVQWSGWSDHGVNVANTPDHPLYGAYHAARAMHMAPAMEEARQQIDREDQDGDHFQAAAIARRMGDDALRDSHLYASRGELNPAPTRYSMSRQEWDHGWDTAGPEATGYGADLIPEEIFERLPGVRQNGGSYPSRREAWDAYHEGHRKWREDQHNGIA